MGRCGTRLSVGNDASTQQLLLDNLHGNVFELDTESRGRVLCALHEAEGLQVKQLFRGADDPSLNTHTHICLHHTCTTSMHSHIPAGTFNTHTGAHFCFSSFFRSQESFHDCNYKTWKHSKFQTGQYTDPIPLPMFGHPTL